MHFQRGKEETKEKTTQSLGTLPLKGENTEMASGKDSQTHRSVSSFNKIPFSVWLTSWSLAVLTNNIFHQEHLVPGNKSPASDLRSSKDWIYDEQ